ncbi:hypothetical protein KY345_06950 [Candidatus Woesearchaeota archaeon]|nr:hypothetical protein [Candidatus Woesearchaeota archaeon]
MFGYKTLMQFSVRYGCRSRITFGGFPELLKAYSAGDIVRGDILEINEYGEHYFWRVAGITKGNEQDGKKHHNMAYMFKPGEKIGHTNEPEYLWDVDINKWRKTGHKTVQEWNETLEEKVTSS